MPLEKRSITAEKAAKILKENGTIVTLEEAQIILDLMYRMAKLSINQYIPHTNTSNKVHKDEDSRPIYPGEHR
jgi:hypothetical protein